jgi:hypothetical protein
MTHSSWLCAAACVSTIMTVACGKEPVNCGHGFTVTRVSYEIVDNQGLDWLARPGSPSIDSLRSINYVNHARVERPAQRIRIGGFQLSEDGVPDAGSDQRYTHYLRLSRTDIDTVEVLVHFGALNNSECQRFHAVNGLELRYNGRPAGSFTGNDAQGYAADWGKVVVMHKIP